MFVFMPKLFVNYHDLYKRIWAGKQTFRVFRDFRSYPAKMFLFMAQIICFTIMICAKAWVVKENYS